MTAPPSNGDAQALLHLMVLEIRRSPVEVGSFSHCLQHLFLEDIEIPGLSSLHVDIVYLRGSLCYVLIYDLVAGSSYILKTREFFQPLFYGDLFNEPFHIC